MIHNVRQVQVQSLIAETAPSRSVKTTKVLTPFEQLFTMTISDAGLATPSPATGAKVPATAVQSAPVSEQGAFVTQPGGSTTALNPTEMATSDAATAIAAKLGGTVEEESFTGGFSTSASFRDIVFAGSNVKINAGVAASLFARYGDAPGSYAWQVIGRDLGREAGAKA